MEMGQAVIALVLELPEDAEVLPGVSGNQLLVRCGNNYGASLIDDLRGSGVELAVIGFAEGEQWDFVRGTSLSGSGSIVSGIESPSDLMACLGQIAEWDDYREE